MLKTYRVTVFEYSRDKYPIVFDCWAEDEDHANEQVKDAYRGCVLNTVMEIHKSEYMVPKKWVEEL